MSGSSVLAIDPGTLQSGYALLERNGEIRVARAGTLSNVELLRSLRMQSVRVDHVVVEWIESYGMPVGREIFETVVLVGRIIEVRFPQEVERISRKEVKLRLCGSLRAKDPNVRQAVMDRFGGSSAKGTKKEPGPLYGVTADAWSAIALGLAFLDGPR